MQLLNYVLEKEQKVKTNTTQPKNNMMQVLHITVTQQGEQIKQNQFQQSHPQQIQQKKYPISRRSSVIGSPPHQQSPMNYSPQQVQKSPSHPHMHQQLLTNQHIPQQGLRDETHIRQDEVLTSSDLGLTNDVALYNNLTPRTVASVESMNKTFRMVTGSRANFVFEQHSQNMKDQPNSHMIMQAHRQLSPHLIGQQSPLTSPMQASPMYDISNNYPNILMISPLKTEHTHIQNFHQFSNNDDSVPEKMSQEVRNSYPTNENLRKRKFLEIDVPNNSYNPYNHPQQQLSSYLQVYSPQFITSSLESLVQDERSIQNTSNDPHEEVQYKENAQKRRRMGYDSLRIVLPEEEEQVSEIIEDSSVRDDNSRGDAPNSLASSSPNIGSPSKSLTTSPRFPLNATFPTTIINLPRLPISHDKEKQGFLLSPSVVLSPSNQGILSLMGVADSDVLEQGEGASITKVVPTPRALDNINTPMSIPDDRVSIDEGFKLAAESLSSLHSKMQIRDII